MGHNDASGINARPVLWPEFVLIYHKRRRIAFSDGVSEIGIKGKMCPYYCPDCPELAFGGKAGASQAVE